MDKCNYNFEYGHYLFPRFIPETGDDPKTYILKLIDEGVKKHYPVVTKELTDRIEYELGVIEKTLRGLRCEIRHTDILQSDSECMF